MNRQDFLDEICNAPGDDTPRLKYADWLQDVGGEENEARADFIRAGINFHHNRNQCLRDGRELGLEIPPRGSYFVRRPFFRPFFRPHCRCDVCATRRTLQKLGLKWMDRWGPSHAVNDALWQRWREKWGCEQVPEGEARLASRPLFNTADKKVMSLEMFRDAPKFVHITPVWDRGFVKSISIDEDHFYPWAGTIFSFHPVQDVFLYVQLCGRHLHFPQGVEIGRKHAQDLREIGARCGLPK